MSARFDYGRSFCADPDIASRREWLVTNGLGGYAAGTVAGLLTRRYHGLLIAALKPPVGRTLLVAALHETATFQGETHSLHLVRWRDGTCDLAGLHRIERFRLEGTTPVWTFAIGDALLEKRILMEPGRNTTLVKYDLLRASGPVTLRAVALVNFRDAHGQTRAGALEISVSDIPGGVRVAPPAGPPFAVLAPGAEARGLHDWYLGFDLAEERSRGFPAIEDHLAAAELTKTLVPGDSMLVVATAERPDEVDPDRVLESRATHEEQLLQLADVEGGPVWVKQLVLAADQFVVQRPSASDPDGLSIVAGYPWFADWGRDAMISIPGLALSTGRPEVARAVLHTWARHMGDGLIPNRFPDDGSPPEYNAADATLWYLEALRRYSEETGDLDLVAELWPALEESIAAHQRGTRFGISVDPTDGLLRAGEPGVAVTWMDAKVGDFVVTPRVGKPVEINALWHQALRTMTLFATELVKPAAGYHAAAERARAGFARFWNPETKGLFDVLDGPEGNDPAVRPNQLYAVALSETLLPREQGRAILGLCARKLLTSHGLRSLAAGEPGYRGRYQGDVFARDTAYHQGTVWGFLLGPFALAYHRLYGNASRARSFLEPLGRQMDGLAVGTLAEIFDGDPPHAPRGCFAQAWTVAETLRAWKELRDL